MLRGGIRKAARTAAQMRHASPGPLKYGTPIVVGGAMMGGAISGVLDDTGPYATMQEGAFGDRRAVQKTFRAGISEAFRPNSDNIYGTTDYYHGAPFSPSRARAEQVPGDVVFGMYNMRR